jgi:hypothetical protein
MYMFVVLKILLLEIWKLKKTLMGIEKPVNKHIKNKIMNGAPYPLHTPPPINTS